MAVPLPSLVILAALLALATYWDVTFRRIPNLLAVLTAVGGLLAQGLWSGLAGLGSALAAAAVLVAMLWSSWRRRLVGGGDLKLAAAAATWVGWAGLPAFILGGAVAGGLLSLVCWALSAGPARAEVRANLIRVRLGGGLAPIVPEASGRVSVPYAPAVAAGVAAAFGWGV